MRRDLLFLKDIINAMNKIFNYTEKMTKEEFKNDDLTIDAVLRNIEIIGEAANNLSEEIYDKNENIPLIFSDFKFSLIKLARFFLLYQIIKRKIITFA